MLHRFRVREPSSSVSGLTSSSWVTSICLEIRRASTRRRWGVFKLRWRSLASINLVEVAPRDHSSAGRFHSWWLQTNRGVSFVPRWCRSLPFLRSPSGRNGASDARYCLADIVHVWITLKLTSSTYIWAGWGSSHQVRHTFRGLQVCVSALILHVHHVLVLHVCCVFLCLCYFGMLCIDVWCRSSFSQMSFSWSAFAPHSEHNERNRIKHEGMHAKLPAPLLSRRLMSRRSPNKEWQANMHLIWPRESCCQAWE